MKKNINRIILIIILVVGILADIYMLWGRIGAEMDDRSVAGAVYYHDVARLARYSALPEDEWLSTLSDGGVRYVIFSTQPSQELLDRVIEAGMKPAARGNLEGDWAFVVPFQKKPLGDIGDTPLALMKNAYRTGLIAPPDFSTAEYEGPMIKCVYLYAGFADRYTEELRAQEVENVLFRAITDEGARLMLLKPITHKDKSLVLDPDVYTEMLTNIETRLLERGYSYGEGFSLLEVGTMSPLSIWLTGLVPVALWVFLATRLKFLKRFGPILSVVGLIGTAAACYIMPDLAQKVLAFACATGGSLTLVYALYVRFIRGEGSSLKAVPGYLLGLCFVLGWGVLCGLAVGAIQADLSYLMGETIFAGVKASMMLPIAVCGIVFVLPILRRIIARDFSRREILGMIPAVVLILIALAVLIRRSGDAMQISELENRMRVALEYTFYARPRTKEFLVGVPFIALLFIRGWRRDGMLRLIGALCASIEITSLLNSFCHGFTPIHVSFLRSVLGAACGAVLGLLVIAFFAIVNIFKAKLLPEPKTDGGEEA